MKNTTNLQSRQTTDFGNLPEFVVAAEASLSPAEKEEANRLRKEMSCGLKEVGIDPNPWLAKFDTHCQTIERKREAARLANERVLLKKRAQLIEALGAQNWSLKEVDYELESLGVPGGFAKASERDVSRIWLHYRKVGMIVI